MILDALNTEITLPLKLLLWTAFLLLKDGKGIEVDREDKYGIKPLFLQEPGLVRMAERRL